MSDTSNDNVKKIPLEKVIIELLRERFPVAFCTPPRLLKIGILEDLVQRVQELGEPFNKTVLRKALNRYTRHKAYMLAMKVSGAPRFDLAGARVGSVTDKEAAWAKLILSKSARRKQKAEQPATPAQPAEQPAKVAQDDNAATLTQAQGTAMLGNTAFLG